jgi:hypothetical protein
MSTLAEHRAAASAAFIAAGVPFRPTWQGEPPYVVMWWDGSDLAPVLGDGQVSADFAIVAVISKALDDVALADVDTMVENVYAVLLALDGWRIKSIDPLTRATLGTDTLYSVTFRVGAMTELDGG